MYTTKTKKSLIKFQYTWILYQNMKSIWILLLYEFWIDDVDNSNAKLERMYLSVLYRYHYKRIYIYINISYVWDYSTVVLLNLETLNKYNNNVKQFTKSHRICSLKMLTSGGSFFGTSCSISMLTSFVWYFVVFYFFMGGMKHWCDWDWGGGGHPGLPWAESFPNSRRDHIISTSNQNSQGYLKAFLISWLKMLTLFHFLSFKSLSYEKHMHSRCRFSMVVHDTMHLSAVLM